MTARPAAGAALRVLVAEDDETLRELSRRFVEKLGHTVSTVPHGLDAVQAASTGDYDVILMDVHMPLLDGPRAARRIRAAGDRIAQPRIIALTAAVTTTVRDECLAAGMDGVVTKPFTARDLRQALQDVPAPTAPEPAADDAFLALAELPAAARAEILQAFRERGAQDIDGLADALTAGAAAEVRFLAHRLHGAGAGVGATALARICAEIETDPAADGRATDRIAALRAEFDAVVGRIEAARRGHPSA